MKKQALATAKKLLRGYGASLTCFLLALVLMISGTVSFARYVSGDEFFDQPGIGAFAGSGAVVDVSALSFTNMPFWSELSSSGVSMNSLRNVTFTVSNAQTEENGTKTISEVALEYAVMFTAPQGFAGKLAIQLSDSRGVALTSQLLVADILNCVSQSKPDATFTTTEPMYNGKDYVGVDQNGNTTSVMTFDVHFDSTQGKYTAKSKGQEQTVITVEPVTLENVKQVLYFRLWDVEYQQSTNVTEENGALMPPILLEYTADVLCYKISITRADFKFPAGLYTERDYSLSLAPTDALLDEQLGGYLMQYDNDGGTYVHATEIAPNQSVYISTVTEIAVSGNGGSKEVTLMGSIPKYNIGDTFKKELGTATTESVIESIYTEQSTPVVTTVTSPENGITTVGKTSYYRKTGSRWTNTNLSNATHAISKSIQKTVTTTTVYDARIKESTKASEIYEITAIKNGGMLIEQDGERITVTTRTLLDATKSVTVETEYEVITTYSKKSGGSWVSATASEFSSLRDSMYPSDPEIPHIHPSVSEGVFLSSDPPAGGGLSEIEQFSQKIASRLVNDTNAEAFSRSVTYTSTISEIKPTSIQNTDESVETAPFKTHLESGIQKYYVSMCYSKNYPLFVQLLLRQTQD